MDWHPYDSRQIANYFINLAKADGRSVSIMHVLKLVYLAHGWCLAIYDRPLINDQVQAWRYGPVVRTVYYSFRPYGAHDIEPIALIYEEPIHPAIKDLLERVYAMYRDLSGSQLSALTHIKGGPWHQVYRPHERNLIIPNELIAEHFRGKMARAANA